jgi:hypothetical protein
MSQTKRTSKAKRRSKAVPVLGIAGVSLAMAGGGASASTAGAVADMPLQNTAPVITLGEEEIADVSLSTFYVFDKENARTLQGAVREARGCGCRGCGRGCGRGCRGCGRGCGGGCGGCSCGCCLSWGACRLC